MSPCNSTIASKN
jgi:hypothetical protein